MDGLSQFLGGSRGVLILGLVVAACVWVYLKICPQAIPGIPHSGKTPSVVRDMRSLIKYQMAHGEVMPWLSKQCYDQKSPIAQVFIKPFSKYPIIVVNDYQESYDAITKNTHDLDTSSVDAGGFKMFIPNATIAMPSHEQFKEQRRLWSGTMSTTFLQDVAAPRILKSSKDLVQLWRAKAKLAPDTSFAAAADLRYTTLDVIWAAAVGSELGGLASQLDAVTTSTVERATKDELGAAVLPHAALPPLFKAIELLIDSIGKIGFAPIPALTGLMFKLDSGFREALKLKNDNLSRLLNEARRRYSSSSTPTCAMEQVLYREAATMQKLGKSNKAMSDENLIDELFIWLVAGHETTATTLTWGIKYLARCREAQNTLRAALHQALGDRPLTSADQLNIPYLDAVAWEMLRVARTASGIARSAVNDTTLMGYHIPKGSLIVFSTSAFQYLDGPDAPKVPESARMTKAKPPNPWNTSNIREFEPSRWLSVDENGQTVFELNAGPHLPFGGGPRGCFGRRLAMLELKTLIAELILNFDFQPVPPELDGDVAVEGVTRQAKQCYVRPRPL